MDTSRRGFLTSTMKGAAALIALPSISRERKIKVTEEVSTQVVVAEEIVNAPMIAPISDWKTDTGAMGTIVTMRKLTGYLRGVLDKDARYDEDTAVRYFDNAVRYLCRCSPLAIVWAKEITTMIMSSGISKESFRVKVIKAGGFELMFHRWGPMIEQWEDYDKLYKMKQKQYKKESI